MAVVGFSAWTGFADGRGGDSSEDAVLSGAVCSDNTESLCLDTATSDLASDSASVFALQARADSGAEAKANGAVTPTPTPEPTPEPTEVPVIWATMIVREGDTLIALADWFGVSPFDIAVFNSMSADDYITIGQILWIPVPIEQFVMPPEAIFDEPDPIAAVPAEPQQPPAAIVAPVAPPPPTSGGTWTKDDAVAAICSLPWDCTKMVAVAACESGLRADAVNPLGYYGLFQINYSWDGWDDPWQNASVAYYQKYLPALNAGGDGLSPWPVCRYA